MNQNESKQNEPNQDESNQEKSIFAKYRKEFILLFIGFAIGFIGFSVLFTTNQMTAIKAGEYSDQPMAIRQERLDEAMPKIIIRSILLSLFINLLRFPATIIRFRFKYEVHLVHELKLYFKEKRAKKIEKSQREKL